MAEINEYVVVQIIGVKWIDICPVSWFDEVNSVSYWPNFDKNQVAKKIGYVQSKVYPNKSTWIQLPSSIVI